MAEGISVERLSKVYPGGHAALREVSLRVEPGVFLVLLGPSGSGKTTLLRCLSGIERISSGQIAIGGSTVADGRVHLPPERREASMVFQDYALWPHLTALDNVAFALRRRRLGRGERDRRAMEMLDRVGLSALSGRYPNELSGGEQQRVALARALVGQTGLIFCDEPLSNLDADLRDRMRVEISSLVREAGATTVYITHDQAEAFAIADQVGVLENGRLVQVGPPEEIYTCPATPFVARFTGLSGELPVRVLGVAGSGVAEVEPAGLAGARPFLAQAHTAQAGAGQAGGAGLARGASGVVMIRPTGVSLCSLTEQDHHLAGVVADVAFRGRGYELAIEIPGHGRLTGIFARRRVARGEAVALRLRPGGCHLFAGAGSPAVTDDRHGTTVAASADAPYARTANPEGPPMAAAPSIPRARSQTAGGPGGAPSLPGLEASAPGAAAGRQSG